MNDSSVNYKLINSMRGASGIAYKGIGKYKISSDTLTIFTTSLENVSPKDGPDTIPFPRKVLTNEYVRIDHYKIIYATDSRIELIGPILEDYEEQNRRRFWRRFLNWPWRWSFKKQHWYDPRSRNMIIK